MEYTGRLACLVLIVVSSAAACGTEPWETEEDEDEDVADARSAVVTDNALSANSLSANSLSANALSANALSANALSANSLTMNELSSGEARELFKYIVSCALPSGTHIDLTVDGQDYRFDGQLGLASSWGQEGGSCDAACMGWVSGCVIARLNKLGVSVPISMRGAHQALATTKAERFEYYHMDGAYYGDIFSTPKLLYACLPPWSSSLPRVCGDSLDGCAVTVAGWCNQTCDKVTADGSYRNCRDGKKSAKGTTVYPGSVTIYLPN